VIVTIEQLKKVMPGAGAKVLLYVDWLNKAMAEFDINTELRIEHFLAQIAHESGDLNSVSENLNYSAAGLCQTFRKYFPSLAIAQPYHRQPIRIANKVYANRMDNGDEDSGDGWRYRGAGLIQLTGRKNHSVFAEFFGIPLEQFGDWVRLPEGACRSAARFWQLNGCNQLADADDLDGISDAINIGRQTEKYGDAIGFHDRADNLAAAKAAI
jgi:putative chitinase